MEQIEQLAESPLVQKAIAESERDRERALDEQRAADVAIIGKVHERRNREMPPLMEREAKAKQAVDDAETALLAAQRSWGEARTASIRLSNETERELRAAESRLTERAPDELSAFVRWTWDTFDVVRRTGVTETAGTTGNLLLGQRRRRTVITTMPSLKRYTEALRSAREEALRCNLTLATRADVRARIAELRQSLPAITEELVEMA